VPYPVNFIESFMFIFSFFDFRSAIVGKNVFGIAGRSILRWPTSVCASHYSLVLPPDRPCLLQAVVRATWKLLVVMVTLFGDISAGMVEQTAM
jgi:hypothetical protein